MSAVCVLALNLALNNNNITIKQLEHDFSCRVMKATRRKVSRSTEGRTECWRGEGRSCWHNQPFHALRFFLCCVPLCCFIAMFCQLTPGVAHVSYAQCDNRTNIMTKAGKLHCAYDAWPKKQQQQQRLNKYIFFHLRKYSR